MIIFSKPEPECEKRLMAHQSYALMRDFWGEFCWGSIGVWGHVMSSRGFNEKLSSAEMLEG